MHTHRYHHKGFGVAGMAIALLAVLLIVLVTLAFLHRHKEPAVKTATKTTASTTKATKAEPVYWQYNDQTHVWKSVGGTPPACPSPLLAKSPIDVSKVTGVLYPGQYRSGNYKSHGGITTAATKPENVQVVAPMSGTLTGLTRYIESGALQYKLTVRNDCGIDYYFDHLYTLSTALQKVAETTPTPKVDDTKSLPLQANQQVPVQVGEVLATAAGNPSQRTMGFDFGVLDLRAPNAISRNTTWQGLHETYTASEWFGVCWFNSFDTTTSAVFTRAPAIDQKSGTVSDYCPGSATTLTVNAGKPV